MKDLIDYQNVYQDLAFEPAMVKLRKKQILESIFLFTPSSFLEIGCGLEPIFNEIELFSKMTIVEPSDFFYQNALNKAKMHKKYNFITIHNLLFEDYQPDNENFDFIILSGLLHEISEPLLFLNKIYQVAGENTIIHINVPNAKSFHRLLAQEMGLIENIYETSPTQKKLQINNIFNLDSLSRIVSEAGFDIINKGSYFIKPFTHKQMQFLQDKEVLTDLMIEGFYKMIKYMPELGAEIFVDIRKK